MLNFENLSHVTCLTHEDTEQIGEHLADYLSLEIDRGQGFVIALRGELGVGKTTFTKGFAKALGISTTISSPTYQLMLEYQANRANCQKVILYHIDLYRVETASQLVSLALDDFIYGPVISIIEWAERAKHLLPTNTINVDIAMRSDFSRVINITKLS